MEAINKDRLGLAGGSPGDGRTWPGVVWRLWESEERGSRLEELPGVRDS